MNTFMTFNVIQNIPTSRAALLGKQISPLFTVSSRSSKNYSFFKFPYYSFIFQVFYPVKKKNTSNLTEPFYCYQKAEEHFIKAKTTVLHASAVSTILYTTSTGWPSMATL